MAGNTFAQTQKHEQILTQTLSPQQLLTVQLLELTTMEIEDRVRSEVMDNPALEVVENDDMPENISEGDAVSDFQQDSDDDYSGNGEIPVFSGYSHGDDYVISDSVSFGDTLLEQLAELQLTPEEKTVGEYIIGSLDEDGFLRKDISEIEDELLIYGNVMTDKEQILDVLGRIQAFEPAGIAARNLQECLMLQLNRADSGKDVSLHKRIVGDFYDDFTAKHWEQIADKLGVSKEDCRSAIADIVRLNPRPGASLSENVGFSRQQIIPDFVLDVVDDNVYVSLNNVHVPELRVSDEYVQMLDEQLAGGNQEQKAAATFLKQKIDSAKGFISAVKQRENTMLSTMRAIVAKQKDYFINGGDAGTPSLPCGLCLNRDRIHPTPNPSALLGSDEETGQLWTPLQSRACRPSGPSSSRTPPTVHPSPSSILWTCFHALLPTAIANTLDQPSVHSQ